MGEVFGVYFVDGGVVVHVVEEDGDLDDLFEGAACGFEDGFEVFEGLSGLGFDGGAGYLASVGITGDLSGDEEEVSGADGRGKGADGVGGFKGGFGGPAAG